MGSSFAPSIANLFMTSLENNFILNADVNPFFQQMVLFYRFIDDCFCVFKEPSQVNDFVNWLNRLHTSISFTVEGDQSEVHFLDTIVYKDDNNSLAVEPYNKPTDKNNYLHFHTFHSRQLKINIPYGQFLRLKRNATKDKDYLIHAKRPGKQFQARKYL